MQLAQQIIKRIFFFICLFYKQEMQLAFSLYKLSSKGALNVYVD